MFPSNSHIQKNVYLACYSEVRNKKLLAAFQARQRYISQRGKLHSCFMIGKQDGEGIHLRIEKLHHSVSRRFKQHFILSKERILNE